MNKKQLMAISYAIAARRKTKWLAIIADNGLTNDFRQSKYTSAYWYLKSKDINPYTGAKGGKNGN